jgi:hypothetical protein
LYKGKKKDRAEAPKEHKEKHGEMERYGESES